MAEAVLFNIAEGIITKLGSLGLQEIGLRLGVKDDFEKLKRTVSTIKAVLLDAEQQSLESNQVKVWLGMLKEAIYDADDLLDEFSTKALRQQMVSGTKITKEVRRFFSSSNQFTYGLQMARRIKAIRDRLDEIAADRKFHLEQRSEETLVRSKSRDQTHSSAPEVIVGREEDKEAIIELLMSSNDEENVSTISIVGIGGLGKTTLAQLVYNDEKIKMHFELRLWACVSDLFDVKLIVEKLIESDSRKKPRTNEMEASKNLLHEKINGAKFLIVLDDVWNEDSEKWFRLKDLLVGGAKGSKIILTTRLRKVAELSRPIYVHELKGLNETEAWSLFVRMAFKRGQEPSRSREAIGREIVERCSGVPLAIKTIGGLLYLKDSESEWLSFKDEELSEVDQHESDILPTLKLSYNHLPSHLKHCFAYCSLFPKDYKIDVELLIHLWMAQGYVVSSDPHQCLEEIGNKYFVDLHWRSFFQEVERDFFGNIKFCKMHDLMHDLAMLVAGEECVLSNTETDSINARSRHLSFQCKWDSEEQFPSSFSKASKARTFLILDGQGPQMKEEQCNEIFSSLRCLRVLDLHHLQIETVPLSIGKLKHLRFLNLSKNKGIKILPDSITELQNLQVLNLNECTDLQQLPKDIKNLVNLSHLDNGCSGLTHMPRGIGQLTRLEKLPAFVVAEDDSISKVSGGLDELNGMNLLRGELEIVNLNKVRDVAFECKAANLKEKRHLQRLRLYWNPIDSSSSIASASEVEKHEMVLGALDPHRHLKGLHLAHYIGVKIPSWFSSLTYLVDIDFFNCTNIKRLPPFDQLFSLKNLGIRTLPNLEYIESGANSGSSSFFPSLEELFLCQCPKLKGWNAEKAELLQFPCLASLGIRFCPNLTSMPLSPSLKDLSLDSMILTSEYSFSSSSSSFPYSLFSVLSQLESLDIWGNVDLNIIPETPSSITLPLSYDHIDDQLLWRRLKSLHVLSFARLPNLVSLPNGLQHLTTLRTLIIRCSPELESLPNGPQYLTSLHTLKIDQCPKLSYLPDWIHNLTGLQFLNIFECPQLAERCKDNKAPDWPKIAHIPNIEIDGKWIQRNRSYLL